MYYRGANAAILVYDITGTESFQELIAWVAGTAAVPSHIYFSNHVP